MKSRLLLIDKETNFRRSLAIDLRQHGFDVWEAGSNFEAEQLLEQTLFDSIILDVEPVFKDWQALVEYIQYRQPDSQLIFTSAFDYSEMYPILLEWGDRPFFVKPFKCVDLVRLCRKKAVVFN